MMNEKDFLELMSRDPREGKLEVTQRGDRFVATFFKQKIAAIGNTEMEAVVLVQEAISRMYAEAEERLKHLQL